MLSAWTEVDPPVHPKRGHGGVVEGVAVTSVMPAGSSTQPAPQVPQKAMVSPTATVSGMLKVSGSHSLGPDPFDSYVIVTADLGAGAASLG